jgi:hypothetical protein
MAFDEFEEVQRELGRPGVSGWWERVLPELTDKQADDLLNAADNAGISHRTISVVLGRWGHKVTPAQVGHWRRSRER